MTEFVPTPFQHEMELQVAHTVKQIVETLAAENGGSLIISRERFNAARSILSSHHVRYYVTETETIVSLLEGDLPVDGVYYDRIETSIERSSVTE